MPAACMLEVVMDPTKFIFAGVSLSFAIIFLVLLTRMKLSNKSKISLIYAHLFSAFFPFVLLSTNLACGTFCLPCFEEPISLVLISLPTTMLLSGLAGFVVIPGYYMLSRKTFVLKNSHLSSFVKSASRKMKIKPPSLYILNRGSPLAFSFSGIRSAIFLSVGLLELLSMKEAEAVIVHELAHIKLGSSLLKLSTRLLRFSPFFIFKNFHRELGREEKRADCTVIKMQGTDRHLVSAKRKMECYHSCTSG